MPSKFGGIPVDSESPKSKFGGIAVEQASKDDTSKEKGIIDRIGQDWESENKKMSEHADKYVAGEQSLPSTYFQNAGNLANKAFAVPAEAAKSLNDKVVGEYPIVGIGEALAKSGLQKAANYVSDSPVGDVARQYSEAHPEATRNLGAATSIAGVLPLGAGGTAIGEAVVPELVKGAKEIPKTLYKSGSAAHKEELWDAISPKETKATVGDKEYTTKGLLRTRKPVPDRFDQEMIDVVSSLKDEKGNPLVHGRQSALDIKNTLNKEVEKKAKALKEKLAAIDAHDPQAAIIPTDSILSNISNKINALANKDVMLKDSPHIDKIMGQLKNILPKKGATASQILDARKEFDRWIEKYKGEKTFDPDKASAFSETARIVRQTLNDTVDAKYPYFEVKKALKEQHNIYNAMENVSDKIRGESKTNIGRLVDKIPGSKNPYVKAAEAVGLGLVGHSNPALAGATMAGYGAYKGATNPLLRMKVGKALGGAAPKAKKPAGMLALPAPKKSLALPSPDRPFVPAADGTLRSMTDDELALTNLPKSEQLKRVQKVPQGTKETEYQQAVKARKLASDWDVQATKLKNNGASHLEIENKLGKRPKVPALPYDSSLELRSLQAKEKLSKEWEKNYQKLSAAGYSHKEIVNKLGKQPKEEYMNQMLMQSLGSETPLNKAIK